MRNALVIAGKEFRHMRHDRLTLTLVLIVPLMQLIVYGYALDTRFQNLPIALLNRDQHAGGRALEQRIAQSPLFAVDESVGTEEQVLAGLRRGSLRAGIEIPADFTRSALERKDTRLRVWVDGADVTTSNYLLAALEGLGMHATLERVRGGGEVRVEPAVLFNPSGNTAAFLLPGLIAILVQLICTLLMALSFAGEWERGTMEQLLVTRIGVGAILGGKALAVAAVGIGETMGLFLLLRWMFQVPVAGSILLFGAMIPLLVLAPIGIGMLIATRARTQLRAVHLTQVVILPSVLLSGFVLPREFLREPLGRLADLLPATYLVALVRGIVLRGAGAAELAPVILAAAGFGIGLTAAGYWGLRRALGANSVAVADTGVEEGGIEYK